MAAVAATAARARPTRPAHSTNLPQKRRSDFTLTDDTAAEVLQVCQRLDGLPLAIELAGARLDDCSVLRAGGSSTEQTLRATMEWRYGLLSAGANTCCARWWCSPTASRS